MDVTVTMQEATQKKVKTIPLMAPVYGISQHKLTILLNDIYISKVEK
jgi:hypothetical protein